MTLHADGFPIFAPSFHKKIGSAIGCGYTICDYAGCLIQRDYDLSGMSFAAGELWGVMAAVAIARPGDQVVSDSKDAILLFNNCQISRVDDPRVRTLILRLRLYAFDNRIEVSWRSRNALTAGRYNECMPVRGLRPVCLCGGTACQPVPPAPISAAPTAILDVKRPLFEHKHWLGKCWCGHISPAPMGGHPFSASTSSQ